MNTNIKRKRKNIIKASLLLASGLLLCSLNNKINSGAEIVRQVGTTEDAAHRLMLQMVSGNSVYIPNFKKLKAVTTNNRASFATDCFEYIKTYTRSSKFLNEYEQERQSRKPQASEHTLSQDVLDQYRASMDAAMKQYQEIARTANEATKKEINKAIEEYKKEMYKLENPQADAIAKWEKEYPANPEYIIKEMLQTFLQETAAVNFSASLHDNGYGKMKFDNNEYEYKSASWKMCYRAGREATDAVRKYAQTWLQEINN